MPNVQSANERTSRFQPPRYMQRTDWSTTIAASCPAYTVCYSKHPRRRYPILTPSRAPQQQPFQSLRTRAPAKPLERLPTLNYSLFKETLLRKKMKELGIPDWGPRALLQRRHTEWMNLWNANCDAKVPKTKEELRRDLDVWERSQGGAAPQFGLPMAPNAVMAKSFDAAAWSVNHEDDFKQLIANARRKKENKNIPAQNSEEAKDSSTAQQQENSTIQSTISISEERHVVIATQPPSTIEGSMGVGEISGHAPALSEPYNPFALNGDVVNRVQGDSSSYPPT
jgi:E3 ubiquitin-protein ligase RAD18